MEFVGQGRGNYEVQHETHIDGYRVRQGPYPAANHATSQCTTFLNV